MNIRPQLECIEDLTEEDRINIAKDAANNIRPGETDERGVCLLQCGRVWHRSLWCWPCSLEFTGEP